MDQEHISISSGTWSWQVTGPGGHTGPHTAGTQPAGAADPDPEADSGNAVLVLQDPGSPNDWMIRELSPTMDPSSMGREELESLARHPDIRQVSGPEGEVWNVRRVPPPGAVSTGSDESDRAPLRVQASRGGEPPRLVKLPEGKALGEMRKEELLPLLNGGDESGDGGGEAGTS